MIRLLYNYYEDKNPIRKKEIDLCLQKNLANPWINTVIIESQNKLTYNYFFDKINSMTGEQDINVMCNSDIFLDETIRLVETMAMDQVYALSRWDYRPDGKHVFFNRADSQDTWIFRGHIRTMNGDFTLGRNGCDNRIAHEIKKAGYKLNNPSQSVKTYHVHSSNIRNHTRKDTVPGPYLTIGTYAFPPEQQ